MRRHIKKRPVGSNSLLGSWFSCWDSAVGCYNKKGGEDYNADSVHDGDEEDEDVLC